MRRPPLRDQVAVITGASSGIGRACSVMLADAGARVVLLAREEQALQAVVDEITERGGTARHIVCDVTDAAQLEAAAARADQGVRRRLPFPAASRPRPGRHRPG